MQSWIDLNSKGDDAFTALHFASFHGNTTMIKLLIRHGADAFASNSQGINMLHVAAQGDQPVSIAYFLDLGLDINSRDARNSTPLHWASFSGAELTMSYIVAWGGGLEHKDTKGLTPLHLAVKSYREFHSMKGIKQLLIKGADRDALDLLGKKPTDHIAD